MRAIEGKNQANQGVITAEKFPEMLKTIKPQFQKACIHTKTNA